MSHSERDNFRPVPEDAKAELATLASLSLSGSADDQMVAEIFQLLTAADFLHDAHGVTFNLLRQMWQNGEPRDPVSIRAKLQSLGIWDEIGGSPFLTDMVNGVPDPKRGLTYARIVSELSRRRQIIQACNRIEDAAYDPQGATAAEIGQRLVDAGGEIVTRDSGSDYSGMDELAEEAWTEQTEGETQARFATGFADFTHLDAGKFYIVAGRPSMGKSLWAKSLVYGLASHGTPVGIISPDETRRKIINDMAAQVSGLSASLIDERRMTQDELAKYADALGRLKALPIKIADSCSTIEQAEALAALWKAKYGICVLLLDYLQLFGTTEREANSTTSRVTVVTKRCKHMFRRLDMAGLVVCQLNRANEARDDKRPRLSDMRESGEIEQAADVVMGLHRDGYYRTEMGESLAADWAEAWAMKNKSGARMSAFVMRAELPCLRFLPVTREKQREYWDCLRRDGDPLKEVAFDDGGQKEFPY